MPFIIYDTETTGLNTTFDQVLQFAAIYLDDNFNQIDEVNLRCQIEPHIIPSPGALLATGVSIEQITDPSLPTHFEMMSEIADKFSAWGPATFIGHNSIAYDDNLLRRGFFVSLLDPYFNLGGASSRADTLSMARAFHTLTPAALNVPRNEKGKEVFRLEPLALANGYGEFTAHDALADVKATAFLARLMKDANPALFQHLIDLGDKAAAKTLIENGEAFLSLNALGRGPIVAHSLFEDPAWPGTHFVVDLACPPSSIELATFKPGEMISAYRQNGVGVFRRIRLNSQPIVLRETNTPEHLKGLFHNVKKNRDAWLEAIGIINALKDIQGKQESFPDGSGELEEMLYDGFPDWADRSLMRQFHKVNWPARVEMLPQLHDQRYVRAAKRIIARHTPELLSEAERDQYATWLQTRIAPNHEVPWATKATAREELNTLLNGGNISPEFAHDYSAFLETK